MSSLDLPTLIASDLKEINYCNLEGQVEFDKRKPIPNAANRPNWSVYKGVYQGSDVCVESIQVPVEDLDLQGWKEFSEGLICIVAKGVLLHILIFDWCKGGNVCGYLTDNPNANRRNVIRATAEAIAYLHSNDILDCEIRPTRIMVDADGNPRFRNYGFSEGTDDMSESSLPYEAPELISGQTEFRNKKTDIWAFGCTAGQLLHDRSPYHHIPRDLKSFRGIGHSEPPFTWDNPDDFERVIQRCWVPNPDDRPDISKLVGLLGPLELDKPRNDETPETASPDHVESTYRRLVLELTCVRFCNLGGKVTLETPLIDSGTYGEVYKGAFSEQTVCVKNLKPVDWTPEEKFIKLTRRFKREIQVWHKLTHRNIVQFHGWTLTKEVDTIRASFISAWCGEGNLRDYLTANRDADRHGLVRDIARGVAYLHGKDVVHGDIKPENIVIHDSVPKLCDFGLSAVLNDAATFARGSSANTTLRYSAPELFEVEGHPDRNKQTDVWAYGCTAAEALEGKRPFHSISDILIYKTIEIGRPPYEWPSNPSNLESVIWQCLIRSPGDRPTMDRVHAMLCQTINIE